MTNHWEEANGGLRASTLLHLSAVAYLVSAILNLLTQLLSPAATGPDDPMFLFSLMVWDVTLFLLGTAFLWAGFKPTMGRFGIVVGIFILVQGLALLVSLLTRAPFPVPPTLLTAGRTLLLAVFAVSERKFLGPRLALLLGLVPGLQFLRIFLRIFEYWPPMDLLPEAILTTFFMVLTAVAVYLVGDSSRRHENEWALAAAPRRTSRFAAFNNPQHEWNRPQRKQGDS